MNDEHRTLRDAEAMRQEIRRSLARSQETMRKQAERMGALHRGEPDPHPKMDQRFVDEMVRDALANLQGPGSGGGER